MSCDRVVFIGGPFDGNAAQLKKTPARVKVGDRWMYERIDDPDTGEFLGAYAFPEPEDAS